MVAIGFFSMSLNQFLLRLVSFRCINNPLASQHQHSYQTVSIGR